MPSPFRVFRRHQKVLLALLGLMAMISFVFLPIALDRISAGRSTIKAAVTTDRYGDISELHMEQLRRQRQILLSFLHQVEAMLREQNAFARDAVQARAEIGPVDEESIVNSWLLAQRARELGIVISNRTVNEFLQMVTRGVAYNVPAQDAKDPRAGGASKPQFREVRLGAAQVKGILRNLNVGHVQFIEICRSELLAMRLDSMFAFSLTGIPPGQRWDYFQRLNRKATVEILPVSVDRFVKQIETPPEAVLREFYEKHKNRLPSPDSPEPGFKDPHRIAVEYLKAEQSKYAAPSAVTDEQIQQYYDQFKDIYFREEPEALPLSKSSEELGPGPGKPKPGESGEGPEKPGKKLTGPAQAPRPSPDAKADVSVPSKQPKPAEKAQPGQPSRGKASADKHSELPETAVPEPPAKTKPEASPAKPPSNTTPPGKASGPGGEKSSGGPGGTAAPIRMVAFQAKDVAKTKSEGKTAAGDSQPPAAGASAPAAPDVKPTTSPTAGASSGKADTSADRPAESDKPAAETSKARADQDKPAQPTPEPPPSKMPSNDEAKPEALPTKYVPLEKVKDKIRDLIAQKQAGAKMQEVLNGLRGIMENYHRRWLDYQAVEKVRRSGSPGTPPPRPDLKELGKPHGLTYHVAPLFSVWEAGRLDIAASIVPNPTGKGPGTPFIAYAFDTAYRFRPEISQDISGNLFLFWKIDDVPEREPAFSDLGVAERVALSWKQQEARALAREEANRLAEEARKAGKSLTELFGTRPGFVVTKSEPFSWLTFRNIPAALASPESRLRISEVRGVDQPSDQFMSTVFALQAGEIGVAPNQPQNTFYVIRVIEFTPPIEQLWNSFREGFDTQAIYSVAAIEQRAAARAWLEELKRAAGLKWKREPMRARPE